MNTPTTTKSSERAKLAYNLREEGHTFRFIGEELGCSPSRANTLYHQWRKSFQMHNRNYNAFGAAADVWPIQITSALLRSGIVNIDHLQQIIIHHQLAYSSSNVWYAYSRQFTFRKIGHIGWTKHILPYLQSIGFDYTPYGHQVDLTKPKPVEAS